MWNELNEAIGKCARCRLSETRVHALCGEGDRKASLFLVALSPGAKEDREGRMFIGPSGRVLDELLQIGGIDRKTLYMTNLVKCRLPKNRKPKVDEMEACGPYLDKEIELVDPILIAPLGHYATRRILAKYRLPVPPRPEFRKVYGTVFEAEGKRILPVQHPSSVLHDFRIKEALETNFRKLGSELAGLAQPRKKGGENHSP